MTMTLSGLGTITGLVAGGLPDGSVTSADLVGDAVPLGVGQTRQDLTGSRAVGTTYTNSTGRAIFVHIDCTNNTAGGGFGLNLPSGVTLRSSRAVGVGGACSLSGLVLAGETYSITAISGVLTLITWVEIA